MLARAPSPARQAANASRQAGAAAYGGDTLRRMSCHRRMWAVRDFSSIRTQASSRTRRLVSRTPSQAASSSVGGNGAAAAAGASLDRGLRDTLDIALSIFKAIRELASRLGFDSFIGPLRISEGGFKTAKYGGLAAFIPFLGLISINLAVINFLPIPPLDGGQMVSSWPKRSWGCPLPENAILWPTIGGIVFVLLLFVGIILKDVIFYIL